MADDDLEMEKPYSVLTQFNLKRAIKTDERTHSSMSPYWAPQCELTKRYIITINEVAHEIIVFNDTHVHIYGILELLLGKDLALFYYYKYHMQKNSHHGFYNFSRAFFDYGLCEETPIVSFTHQKIIMDAVKSCVPMQIDHQCGNIFTKSGTFELLLIF